MEYLSVILIITVCSLLHDGNYTVTWAKKLIGEKYGKYFGKGFVVALHTIAACLVTNPIAALASVGIFWGVFRRGWQAKAELTALNLHDDATMYKIVKAYPPYIGYIPMWITRLVVKLPFQAWHRRIQSGLIALLCTAPISAIPVLVTGVL